MKRKRKYYRKCEICGEKYEQSDMVRTISGWICLDCYQCVCTEEYIEEW